MEITLGHTYRWHATTETYRWHGTTETYRWHTTTESRDTDCNIVVQFVDNRCDMEKHALKMCTKHTFICRVFVKLGGT